MIIQVTPEQYTWLVRNIPRQLERARRAKARKPKEISDRVIELWNKLAERFEQEVPTMNPQSQIELKLSKHERHALGKLCARQADKLSADIIPGYEQKKGSGQEVRKYIEKARATLTLLRDLADRMEHV